ncbi:transporter substrate-binding domain-containing protein [Solwaraspora sp. WMMD791]|uniref:transporter substrate-binding domain-containing protein n=1 Tax=Solwaraspora sp. WMMD791 TaxID=3016086 RepID=UPI00249C47D0|nr:transporter substrate-binding domain-containing protein [Solwaraspora sp. WMMD791]WFE26227.1 transporter substrate-binding domain-containing protein [Solwaraspora sp. WMMD791]
MTDVTISPDPVRRSRRRQLVTTVAVAATLLLASAAACDDDTDPGLPTVQQLREASTIHDRAKLRIGVNPDFPLMSYLDGNTRRGFDVEVARYIARSLGFEGDQSIQWVPLTTEQRVEFLRSGKVDIVVASFSITDDRAKDVGFAGPYLITTPEVLVLKEYADEIQTIPDLRKKEYAVCVAGGSTTQGMLKELSVPVGEADSPSDCRDGLLDGKFQAMVSDETILAGFLSEHPTEFELVDMPFGVEEALGIGVPLEDENLRDLVAYFLAKSYEQSQRGEATAWQTAYITTLGNWLGEAQQPPPIGAPDLLDHDDKIRQ